MLAAAVRGSAALLAVSCGWFGNMRHWTPWIEDAVAQMAADGMQRAVVHRLLAGHTLVEDYWDAPESHLGATVVRLRRARPEPGTRGTGPGTQ